MFINKYSKIMQRNFMIVIMASLFLAETAIAERAQDHICNPRVPAIEYDKAIHIAKIAMADSKIIDESFIDIVSLECIDNVYHWKIGFRKKTHESGYYLVYVYMDGSAKTSAVKDG